MTSMPIAIDANVLLSALLCPTGKSARLLQLAALGIFVPIIGTDVLSEAESHARLGIGGRVISDAELLAFRATIAAYVEPVVTAGEFRPDALPLGGELGDSRVLAAASRHRCENICVGAEKDFSPEFALQGFRCQTPAQLLAALIAEEH
jgi:hypothetical protein